MTQDEALDILKMGYSVFLTGAPGTGKTFVLNEYIKYLKSHNIYPAITASTGIAATHIGGQTIHSWSGIGIYEKLDASILDKLDQNEKLFKRIKSVKILIIDEISMLHASRLEMINFILKRIRKDKSPFGGLQIIFCGDFCQLPPITSSWAESSEKDFVYTSKVWQELNPVILYLTENYRHKDQVMLDILDKIRSQRDIENVYQKLYENIKQPNLEKQIILDTENKDEIIKLYTHNIDIDNINKKKYEALSKDKKEFIFEVRTSGKSNLIENLKSTCLAPEILYLKVGVKVIFVRNDLNKRYQNGTLGEIIDFDVSNMPIVKTFSGTEIIVQNETWQYVNEDGKVLAEINQLPLRYAWAITVHKSQGMTLDAAEIDLSRAFGTSMGYVALSRVKRFENITLIGLHPEALKMNPSVIIQNGIFQQKSEMASKNLKNYYNNTGKKEKEILKKFENFILVCNGDLKEHSLAETEKIEKNNLNKIKKKKYKINL